jgi:hypothetical protein
MKRFGMRNIGISFLLIVFSLCTVAAAQESENKPDASRIRVGTFDSRAVAVAYARSETFSRFLMKIKEEHAKAKSEGNESRVREIETEMPALQELLHKQGFSTYSVSNILEKIKERIPGIAKQAGVEVIVSKWDLAYQQAGLQLIDVTDFMVQLFNPDEKTLEIIRQLKKQDPVTLEALQGHED